MAELHVWTADVGLESQQQSEILGVYGMRVGGPGRGKGWGFDTLDALHDTKLDRKSLKEKQEDLVLTRLSK